MMVMTELIRYQTHQRNMLLQNTKYTSKGEIKEEEKIQ